jgi:flagellar hook-associated protein 1
LSFLSSTTYSVNGGPPQTYSSGGNIEVNGWRVTINGTPATGDSFNISDNINGSGDNRNALALNDSLKRPLLDNGTVSLDAAAAQLVGSIGVATRQAQTNRDAQQVVQQDSLAARDSVSGVNLDEEAANMLRYQQAYQAAAQVIRVASTLFDSLLSATRR